LIEIKSDNSTYVVCPPSTHPNGYRYQIMGTDNIQILDTEKSEKLENVFDKICEKYNKKNKSKLSTNDYSTSYCNILTEDLRKITKILNIDEHVIQNCKIYEGTRHSTLLSFANSMLLYHYNNPELKKDSYRKLKSFLDEVNERLCIPSPLSEKEVEIIWNDTKTYISNLKDKNSNNLTNNPEINCPIRLTGNNKESNNERECITIEKKTEDILKKYHFITLEETKEIYYYKDGVYIFGGEIIIEKEAEKTFGYRLSNKDLSEIKGHVMRKTFHKRTELDKDVNIINLRNGLYSIDTNEFKEHSPEYLSVNQKPIIFNPNSKTKLLGKFLSQVLYPGEIRTAIEAMAYTFYRDTPFEHLFILYGEGGNGKSVFTGLLTALHGEQNVSNVSLSAITNNTFALADLEFKDVNIDTELSNVGTKDTSNLKKLTGGKKQLIRIERKNQHARDAPLHAKLFFNTNKITTSVDQTDAYFRREILISFPNTFHGKKDDPNILYKIKHELPGIFNILMIALRTLLKNKQICVNNKTIEDKRLKHEISSQPIKSFINEVSDETSTCDEYITKADLYGFYIMFCNKHSIAIKSIESFGKELKKLGYQDGRESKGDRRTIWYEIKIKEEYITSRFLKNQYQTILNT
jgi:P4 family phage/plasmid primase-like protien